MYYNLFDMKTGDELPVDDLQCLFAVLLSTTGKGRTAMFHHELEFVTVRTCTIQNEAFINVERGEGSY
jgi:hypothetical protein